MNEVMPLLMQAPLNQAALGVELLINIMHRLRLQHRLQPLTITLSLSIVISEA